MKIIVAGSRTVRDGQAVYVAIEQALADEGWEMTELVSGAQRSQDPATGAYYGVDHFAEGWSAREHIPITRFPARWSTFGRAAGPRRNGQMAAYGEALIAILDPTWASRGTKDMIRRAMAHGLPIYHYRIRGEESSHGD